MAAIPRQQLMALADLVDRWTGLHFPPERSAELERGLVRAAKDFGYPNTTSFVNFCLTTASLTADQVQTLAWHLTIGETYFLRGTQAFDVLEHEILPESSQRAATTNGNCASGARVAPGAKSPTRWRSA